MRRDKNSVANARLLSIARASSKCSQRSFEALGDHLPTLGEERAGAGPFSDLAAGALLAARATERLRYPPRKTQ